MRGQGCVSEWQLWRREGSKSHEKQNNFFTFSMTKETIFSGGRHNWTNWKLKYKSSEPLTEVWLLPATSEWWMQMAPFQHLAKSFSVFYHFPHSLSRSFTHSLTVFSRVLFLWINSHASFWDGLPKLQPPLNTVAALSCTTDTILTESNPQFSTVFQSLQIKSVSPKCFSSDILHL